MIKEAKHVKCEIHTCKAGLSLIAWQLLLNQVDLSNLTDTLTDFSSSAADLGGMNLVYIIMVIPCKNNPAKSACTVCMCVC